MKKISPATLLYSCLIVFALGFISLTIATVHNSKLLASFTEKESAPIADIDKNQSKQKSGNSFLSSIIPKALAYVQQNVVNPTCMDNWETWTSSTVFNPDADWSTALFPLPMLDTTSYYPYSFDKDLNGDGLLDYVNSYTLYGTAPSCGTQKYLRSYSCVLLSNGHGWEVAYKCFVRCENDEVVFYGDCAG